jgi:hypothetical protein
MAHSRVHSRLLALSAVMASLGLVLWSALVLQVIGGLG